MAKKNDNSEYFKDWTTKKLKSEAMSYYQSIYVSECYGRRDIIEYSGICAELEDRGITINATITFN